MIALVLAIYLLTFARGMFPINGFVIFGALLAIATMSNGLLLGHGNLIVALYGARCDFLHVPLIFIMPRVIRPKDLITLAKVAMLISIPNTALLVAQFYSPQYLQMGEPRDWGQFGRCWFFRCVGSVSSPGNIQFYHRDCGIVATLLSCLLVLRSC